MTTKLNMPRTLLQTNVKDVLKLKTEVILKIKSSGLKQGSKSWNSPKMQTNPCLAGWRWHHIFRQEAIYAARDPQPKTTTGLRWKIFHKKN
jgi:hypothetical protein